MATSKQQQSAPKEQEQSSSVVVNPPPEKPPQVKTEIRPMQKHTRRVLRKGSTVKEDGIEWTVEDVTVATGPGRPPVGSTLTADVELVEVSRRTPLSAEPGTQYRGRGYVWTVGPDGRTATTMMPVTDVTNQVGSGYCTFVGISNDKTNYLMLQRQYLDTIGKPAEPGMKAGEMEAMIGIRQRELQAILEKSGGERHVK